MEKNKRELNDQSADDHRSRWTEESARFIETNRHREKQAMLDVYQKYLAMLSIDPRANPPRGRQI